MRIRATIIALMASMIVAHGANAAQSLRVPPVELKELSRQCISGDCVDGFGVLEMKINIGTNTYWGNFKEGKYHGFGKLTQMLSRTERAYYDGHWDMGVRSGRGTYFNGKDKLYIGQWKNDVREGRGSYFFGVKDWTENKYSEHWLSDNVENYTGDFVNDLYQGKGTYRWPDGQKYVGEFFANDKHGPGTFIYPSGTIRPQVWEFGRFVE